LPNEPRTDTLLPMTDPVQRLDFGRVSVFLGHKSGKYPDGNQVVVRGSDTRVAFDTPLVANRIGAELDADVLSLSSRTLGSCARSQGYRFSSRDSRV
jgi:hypothetical protein